MARKQTFRLRFTFWLDMLNDIEQDLADYIETLKTQRSFVKTVRNGLRVMRDLQAGQVEILFELFPWIKAEFIAGVMPKPDTDPSGNEKIRKELEQIRDLLLRNSTPPIVASEAPTGNIRMLTANGAAAPGAPRALNVPALTLPTFDDDEDGDTLIIGRDTSVDSALNFVNSMLALQQ